MSPADKTGVIDIGPALRRKRMTTCEHANCEVDDDVASLTCVDCGNEIDPWAYLRQQARAGEAHQRYYAEQQAAFDAWCAQANAKIQRLQDEITALTRKKDRLWNERIDGQPLGALRVRSRRKKG